MSGRTGLVLATVAVVAACDAVLVRPETEAGLLRLQVEASDSASRAVFEGANMMALTITRGEIVFDTVVGVRTTGAFSAARLRLQPLPGSGPLALDVALLVGPGVVFAGSGSVVEDGSVARASVTVHPVGAVLLGTSSLPVIESLGDSTLLWSRILFVTGDSIPGLRATWTSDDPGVVDVVNGDWLVPRGPGTVVVRATHEELRRSLSVTVRQRPATFTGIEPVDTTLSIGETFSYRVFGSDSGGFALQAPAAVDWSAGVGVEVDENGVVVATESGTVTVVARAAGVDQTATVTITP